MLLLRCLTCSLAHTWLIMNQRMFNLSTYTVTVVTRCLTVYYLQAVTKEAAYSLGRNRSSVSQLAAWAITSLACRSKADCNTIAVAGTVPSKTFSLSLWQKRCSCSLVPVMPLVPLSCLSFDSLWIFGRIDAAVTLGLWCFLGLLCCLSVLAHDCIL